LENQLNIQRKLSPSSSGFFLGLFFHIRRSKHAAEITFRTQILVQGNDQFYFERNTDRIRNNKLRGTHRHKGDLISILTSKIMYV
jgi:hypothetical protein